jgi:hypothetical protein
MVPSLGLAQLLARSKNGVNSNAVTQTPIQLTGSIEQIANTPLTNGSTQSDAVTQSVDAGTMRFNAVYQRHGHQSSIRSTGPRFWGMSRRFVTVSILQSSRITPYNVSSMSVAESTAATSAVPLRRYNKRSTVQANFLPAPVSRHEVRARRCTSRS